MSVRTREIKWPTGWYFRVWAFVICVLSCTRSDLVVTKPLGYSSLFKLSGLKGGTCTTKIRFPGCGADLLLRPQLILSLLPFVLPSNNPPIVEIMTNKATLEKLTFSLVSCLQSYPILPHFGFHVMARMTSTAHLWSHPLHQIPWLLSGGASCIGFCAFLQLFPPLLHPSSVPYGLTVLNYW